MVKYKCGHESVITILDSNALSLTAWLEWSESVGINGDKSQCLDCWNNKLNIVKE